MLDIKDNTESEILNKCAGTIIQLYKALNRQCSKEGAISVTGNLIYKRFGYRLMYFDTVEDDRMVIIKNLLYQYSCNNDVNSPTFKVFNFKLPVDEYRKVIYLEDKDSIEKTFPRLNEVIVPNTILSTPVFSQNKLIGILIFYDTCKRKMAPEFKYLVQLAAKELTVVFSRVERHNLALENMLNPTALENILLYNPKENQPGTGDPLQKIVSILPDATGMKKYVLALIDKDGKSLTPYYSNFGAGFINEKRKHSLEKLKTQDYKIIDAMERKKTTIIYDALTDKRCDNSRAKRLGIYSVIFLPVLNTHDEPLGVLCLHNGRYEIFSERQIRFLELIAHRIGFIISNMGYIGNLKTWSEYDGLTNLLNRRAFQNIYKELCDTYKSSKKRFSILMADIDNFKLINDTYGHQVGDKVLKDVAGCVKQNVRGKDIVARYGGEEIIIVLRDIDKEEARIIADRIRHSISILSVDGINVTVSIGIVTFGVDSCDRENLINVADKCLYKAKSIGKNQVVSR